MTQRLLFLNVKRINSQIKRFRFYFIILEMNKKQNNLSMKTIWNASCDLDMCWNNFKRTFKIVFHTWKNDTISKKNSIAYLESYVLIRIPSTSFAKCICKYAYQTGYIILRVRIFENVSEKETCSNSVKICFP